MLTEKTGKVRGGYMDLYTWRVHKDTGETT